MAQGKKQSTIKKKKITKAIEAEVNNSGVQQNIVIVALITLVVCLTSGYMFLKSNFLDGTLFLAVGFALLSSLVDLNRLPKVIRYFVYSLCLTPALLLAYIIFTDFV